MSRRSSPRFRDDVWPWLKYVLVAIAAVGTGCMVVFALFFQNSPGSSQAYTPRADTSSPSPTATRIPQRLAVLGDSWACGDGSSGRGNNSQNGFVGQIATGEGWAWTDACQGGTGYTTDPATNFASRVQKVIDFQPTIVIVEGSTNDYKSRAPAVEAAASDVLTRLKTALPNARIITLQAQYTPAGCAKCTDAARAGVAQASAALGIPSIDPIGEGGWLDQAADFIADGQHPNEQGHTKIAQHLEQYLNGLLNPSPSPTP